LQFREQGERRQSRYDDIIESERNKLAKELADVYPTFETKLADLLAGMAANNSETDAINRSLPTGSGPLLKAELVARAA
jgi:hypothetical protein